MNGLERQTVDQGDWFLNPLEETLKAVGPFTFYVNYSILYSYGQINVCLSV